MAATDDQRVEYHSKGVCPQFPRCDMEMTSSHGTPPPPFIIVTIARAREERTIIMERTGAPESYSDQNSIVTEPGSPLRNGSTRTEANLLVSSSSKSSAHRRARVLSPTGSTSIEQPPVGRAPLERTSRHSRNWRHMLAASYPLRRQRSGSAH